MKNADGQFKRTPPTCTECGATLGAEQARAALRARTCGPTCSRIRQNRIRRARRAEEERRFLDMLGVPQ